MAAFMVALSRFTAMGTTMPMKKHGSQRQYRGKVMMHFPNSVNEVLQAVGTASFNFIPPPGLELLVQLKCFLE